jgi:ABC-type multidrug transport system fused ATPase/permease subunit
MISVERILHYNSLQSELNVVLPAAAAPASAPASAPGDHEEGEGEGRDASSEGGGGENATSQYTLLPSSPSPPALAPDWPGHGAIVFQSVGLRYRHNTPQVLDSLSFSIAGGEMVGVVGRTGAGKSSILVCLFRMVEISKGAIFIDGVNIQSVSLRRLRAAIAIIPQDPVLLSGTLRFQLDPCLQYSDVEVCEALSMVGMLDFVRGMRLGLDELVQEGGENLSHGQRQLLCIARALLRKAKILVIDEGTVRCSLLLFCSFASPRPLSPLPASLFPSVLRRSSYRRARASRPPLLGPANPVHGHRHRPPGQYRCGL